MNETVLSVTQLNTYIKSLMDGDAHLSGVLLEGEISNFKNHYASGHLYFSLKDANSAVRCVMFSRFAAGLQFLPQNDMKVICRGSVTVYPRDGQYQLYVDSMQPAGVGTLALQFEQLKRKLGAEGLFGMKHKRSLPERVQRVAVLTSETGAAVKDIISVIGRRNQTVEIVLCPVLVQGENAAESMVKMLLKVYKAPGIDLIIIGRGGGSMEDLFCFNDEKLIRTIYDSPVPVISAVGHETDFTLCDFVADLRAATPSAAAELAVPSLYEERDWLRALPEYLKSLTTGIFDRAEERLDRQLSSTVLQNAAAAVLPYRAQFSALLRRFAAASKQQETAFQGRLQNALTALSAMNPAAVLLRGYSMVYRENSIINSAEELSIGDRLSIQFANGRSDCTVTEVFKENKEHKENKEVRKKNTESKEIKEKKGEQSNEQHEL